MNHTHSYLLVNEGDQPSRSIEFYLDRRPGMGARYRALIPDGRLLILKRRRGAFGAYVSGNTHVTTLPSVWEVELDGEVIADVLGPEDAAHMEFTTDTFDEVIRRALVKVASRGMP